MTVLHGDCVDILPTLEEEIDLIITSPPYDNLRRYGGHSYEFDRVARAIVNAMSDHTVLVWVIQDQIIDGFRSCTTFNNVVDFTNLGLGLHDTIIYERSLPRPTTSYRYLQNFEYMFVFSKTPVKKLNKIKDRPNKTAGLVRRRGGKAGKDYEGKATNKYLKSHVTSEFGVRSNIWKISAGWQKSKLAHEHPAIFPLKLAEDHIRSWTDEGDLIVDPMAGSGTTLIAARNLNRRYIGIEIHEPYVNLIRRRLGESK